MVDQHATMPARVREPSSLRAKFMILALLAIALGAFLYFDLRQYLSLEALKANRDALLSFTEAHYLTAVILFIAGYCVLVAVSLPGAVIMTLAGGFLFGSVLGTIYVNLGATTGSTVAFLAARYLLRDWVEARFGYWVRPIQDGFSKNAFGYMMTLRLMPVFPFFLINLVSGLTRIRLGTYVAATAVGIVPGSFVYAYAGRQLGTINSLKEIASLPVLLALALLGLLALGPSLYRMLTTRTAK